MSVALYEDGARDSPPIVLLHSIATSAALWLPQLGPLASAFRTLRVDLPGHGASDALRSGAAFNDYADAVAAALDAAGLRSACLVGLSFGAMVAMRLAVRRPDLARCLVLACCAVRTPPPAAAIWRGRIASVEAEGLEAQVEPMLQRWFTPGYAAVSPLTLRWVGAMIRSTPPAGFVAAASIIETLDQTASLPDLSMPIMALAGRHDLAVPPGAMRDLASLLPNARYQALNAAHLASAEASGAFTEAVGKFAAS